MHTGALPGAESSAVRGGEDAIHPEARNWLIEGFRHVGQSFSLFFRTGARITRHPRRFAIDWASGEFRAFNPLAFFATAAGVVGTLGIGIERFLHHGTFSSTEFLVHEVAPYLSYFLLGLLCHGFLTPLGAKRPWYMTLGISLFAGGGPAAAADLLVYGVKVAVALSGNAEAGVSTSGALDMVAAASVLVANGVFLVVFALGLAGIHRIRLWRILVALLAAETVLSVIRVLLFKFIIPEE